ncbi:MAG: aspartyl/asparaginyl beta-hydroxylase domain-containing protein [Gammaproteobacteria bacterium]|jgi:aspartate beta-hydroxylase
MKTESEALQAARADLAAGRAAEALARMDGLVPAELEPGPRTELFLMRAAACRMLGRADDEATALQTALAHDPYCWPALLQKADILEKKGELKAAAVMYRDVLRISPPAGYRPEAFAKPLAHAERMVAMYAEALETTLLQAVGELPGMSQKWREAVSIMSGRTRPFHADCNQLTVPRLPAQPFFRREMFDWVPQLEQHTDAIREEMIAALAEAGAEFQPYIQYRPGEPVNQWAELNHSRAWTSFHLYRGGKPVEENLARCPRTAEALKLIDAVHLAGTCPNAMFSVLAPKAHIPPHHGESNARLVAHLPLVVPPDCLFRVGYDNRRWKEGEVLVFDDTIEHEAWNDSDEIRVVMIFDVWNPLLSLEERAIVQRMAEAERAFRLGA